REKGWADITKDDITGIDIEFKTALKSYHAFKQKFTGIELTEQVKEDIIKDMTLFGAEPTLLKKRLVAKYPEYENQLLALMKSLSCKEWGRLSEKLLNGIAIEVPGIGMVGTIIYQMWETNKNLTQIIASADSPYGKMIEQENGFEKRENIDYSMVEELYVSPATKRQIWKALQVLDEISKAMGHAPKRIFVEMAKEHQESKRSVTRKDELTELYKSIKEKKELFEQLKGEENDKLRSDKLYLYYKQLGTCAYTGRKIEIEDLVDYDIDHIYPRSKTADDSLDNRVLVYKPENEYKSDVYPINSEIQERMRSTWFMWKKKGLISEEKYKRLVRTTELTNEELTGFINRQLVETRQSTKAFTELLKQILPEETEIVYSKARNVSDFRRKFGIIKVRELNDLHHAKDAYLNIVVGNTYHLKFTKDVRKYFLEHGTYRTYNLVRLFEYDVECGKETAWVSGENGSIVRVKKTLASDKVLVTKQLYERTRELFDVQPVKKAERELLPLKSGNGDERLKNVKKYGGYDKVKISYFSLVEGVDKKGRLIKLFVPIPTHKASEIEENEKKFISDIEKKYKCKQVKIVRRKILVNTLLIYEGFKMRITGRSKDRLVLDNANSLILDTKNEKILKEIIKFTRDKKEKKDVLINKKREINDETLNELYDTFQDKLNNTIYKIMMRNFKEKLELGKARFEELTIENKAILLVEILKLFQCNSEMPNLSLIGESKATARIRMSMNVTDRKNLSIIHQSVTGLYETIERINE
ncbi:type II CRISPR RNA-guided endonuclease Cas9, partial [Methanobrevibacter sp.]|uniref:type II CRISPR RNA-guided endonuclease Cas9 n=1 Tax=Methanobrevibacter sp. TaxID=66852 RepID=UPI003870773B